MTEPEEPGTQPPADRPPIIPTFPARTQEAAYESSPGPSAEIPGSPEPAAPSESPEPGPGREPPPSVRQLLGRSLDANLAAVREIRSTSLSIGLLTLAIVAPVIVLHLVFAARVDALASMPVVEAQRWIDRLRDARGLINLADFVALAGLLAVAIDCQLLSIEVIAARVLGRSFDRGRARSVVRRRFWAMLFADILTGLILLIPRAIGNAVVAPRGVTQESQLVVVTLIGVILSIPFAYVATWVLLGRAGPSGAVGRSWRMTRIRPGLAATIAIANAAVQTLALFALGAGLELLQRMGQVLGVDDPAGLGLAPDVLLVAAVVVAAGSLFFTTSALAAGPQTVAYVALGGEVPNDAEIAAAPVARGARRLITRGMLVTIALETLLVVATIGRIS